MGRSVSWKGFAVGAVWPGLRGMGSPSAAQYTFSLSSSFLAIPGPEY